MNDTTASPDAIQRSNKLSPSSNGINPSLSPRTLTYPISPQLSTTLSNHSSISFETVEEVEEQPEELDLSRQTSESSSVASSISLQVHKNKFMSKLNSALHNIHHRRVGSNEPVKHNKK
jgi:hypothetical protein